MKWFVWQHTEMCCYNPTCKPHETVLIMLRVDKYKYKGWHREQVDVDSIEMGGERMEL